ncbi:MAG: hypothetical protein ACOCV1_07350 [Bacillota bacterium]
MNWYKIILSAIKGISLCSNCGLVLKDIHNLSKNKKKLSRQEQIILDQLGYSISHGICKECCLKLYGPEICQSLLDEENK